MFVSEKYSFFIPKKTFCTVVLNIFVMFMCFLTHCLYVLLFIRYIWNVLFIVSTMLLVLLMLHLYTNIKFACSNNFEGDSRWVTREFWAIVFGRAGGHVRVWLKLMFCIVSKSSGASREVTWYLNKTVLSWKNWIIQC